MNLFNNLPPNDKQGLNSFFMYNAIMHDKIAATLAQKGIGIQSFPLADVGNIQDWLRTHAQVHVNEFAQLGLTGMSLDDMDSVDMEDAGQLHDWMQIHSGAHDLVNLALGIVS